MGYTSLDILAVVFLLAFMAASLSVLFKLLNNYQELMKKPEHERISSFMNLIWNTLKMK